MTIMVADYIFEKIAAQGVRDVFFVSGGGIMYLCDALGRNKDLTYWCNYNEQSSATAAEGYARVTEGLGVCLVTTGPGSTNALTGVAGAWMDSIPMVVISGQVRTQIMADYSYQRQIGPQEVNITPMAEPVTKYAVTVMDPADVRYEIEKCIYLARSGRPGPTWINLPLDIQSAEIDPETQRGFVPEGDARPAISDADIEQVASSLLQARRPVLIGGYGIVLSGARQQFQAMVEHLNIPAMTTISAMDLLPEDHPLYQGRFGPGGQRRANFALQNADFVLAIGTSLSISCVGFNDRFAPKAEKFLVNIDKGDLEKKNITIEHPIHADARQFIEKLAGRIEPGQYTPDRRWTEACATWKRDYPPMPAREHLVTDKVDSYVFYDVLSRMLGNRDIVVSGNSLDGCIIAYQGHHVKKDQIAFTSVCYGAMGWDLPALVGAAVGDRSRRAVMVTGDGSFLFNVHELMLLGLHRLNTKLFIFNNDGYQSIINTQNRYFEGRQVGTQESSGVANPDFRLLAGAFRLNYLKIKTNDDLETGIGKVFSDEEPWLIEVTGSREQQRFRASSYRKEDGTLASRPMEDMDPLLPRDELERIMTMFDEDDA